MIVKWTPEVEQDRIDIWDYIVANNPVAAVDLDAYPALFYHVFAWNVDQRFATDRPSGELNFSASF